MNATQGDLDKLSIVMQQRGYLVMVSLQTFEIGEIFHNVAFIGRLTGQSICVTEETNREDFMEQRRLIGTTEPHCLVGNERFYRVTTD